MKPKAIVIDLDGTLLNSNKEISTRSKNALQSIKEKGIYVIFATARPPRAVSFEGFDLLKYGSVVYYNGAMFHCSVSNKDIHFSISKNIVANIIEYCLTLDSNSNISIEVEDQWFSFKFLDYTELMRVKENPKKISLNQIKSYDCTKILVTQFEHSELLIEKFREEVNIIVTDEGQLVQIMSKKSSKENAVKYLVNSLNIDLKDVICFGDDYNDLGLFKLCGYSIAMGNAIRELKEIASEVTATNDKDGVALILERYFSDGETIVEDIKRLNA